MTSETESTEVLLHNKGELRGDSTDGGGEAVKTGEQYLTEERERLARLNSDVSLALIESRSLKEILYSCADAVVRHLDAAFARVWTFDESENVLELQASAGIYTHTDGAHARIPIGKFKIGLIAEERKPHLTNRVVGDERVANQDWARRERMVSFAGYPLIVEEKLVGVIGMFSRRTLDEAAVGALRSIANTVALGIERKRAEEILRKSEQRYRAVVEVSPQAVWTGRADGYITFCNRHWLDYTGMTLAESVGDGWTNAIRPDFREAVAAAWREAATTTGSWEIEVPFRRAADGEYRWHLARGLAVRNEAGEITGWLGVAIDIHERQAVAVERESLLLAEREAREESETLRRINQIISGEQDLQKIVQAVTDAATELTGASSGAFFYNVLDEDGASYMLYTLSGIGREAYAGFPMPRATEMFGPTFRGEGTMRVGDVQKDARYAKNPPYKGMPAGHPPVSSFLSVSVFSRAGEVIGGLFFGHEKTNVFSERDERIVEALAAQASVAMENAQLLEATKRERAKAEAAARENERLLAQAKEANRLKDDFLAVVSHELRTPLNAITGWSSLLMSGKMHGEAAQRAVETINRNAHAQAQIIEDILDISRIISGKLRLDVRLINPGEVIETAVESARPAADAKNIRLQMLLDPQAAPVSGDPDRLQQVVWNLVSNAVKFTPKGGRIQIRLERVNSQVEITVSDTGQGIAPDFLPHVFEHFRQNDSSTSRLNGGLGLGLSIARQIVEMHGGGVSVASPGEGKGATFVVTLPIAIVHSERFEAKEASEPRVHPKADEKPVFFDCPPELNGLRVLIVDDEPDARELLTIVLEQCRAEVLAVASAAETLEKIAAFNPHILVSDIGLPGEDGYDLIRKVRAKEKQTNAKRIPAVALTAYARVDDRMKALAAGFQMHVPKPVEPAELAAVIASLTDWENI